MADRRWYDKDPILKEALELLRLSCDDTKNSAANFILQLQEQVAGEVIEHVYTIMNEYEGKGTGFSFTNYNPWDMMEVINYAKYTYFVHRKEWDEMVERGMKKDFSWDASRYKYEGIYSWLIGWQDFHKEKKGAVAKYDMLPSK